MGAWGFGGTKEERMRELLPLLPVALAGLIVYALALYAIHREKKRS
jgi:hypothetical protein